LSDAPDPEPVEVIVPVNWRRIGVFCGSFGGRRPDYEEAAVRLGRAVAKNRLELVFGGGRVGMMGRAANAALAAGGRVVGVIPEHLNLPGVAHEGLDELIVVDSMHARKAHIAELCDGFVALPGGIGTLEELLEELTWAQLGLHAKPCGLLNSAGFFDHLLRFLDHAVAEGFFKPEHHSLLLIDDDPDRLLQSMRDFAPSHQPKWTDAADLES
jgi:uncharacterized protein (TIGR00730 family)